MTPTTPPGHTLSEPAGLRLAFARTFDAPVDDVWAALTDPARTAAWFGPWTGDPATGRIEVTMSAEDDAPSSNVAIEACDPPTGLVLGFPSPDGTWRLELDLTADGDGTRLAFSQPLGDGDDPTDIGPGWHFYLDRLAAAVAGTPVPDDWDTYYPALKDVYAAP